MKKRAAFWLYVELLANKEAYMSFKPGDVVIHKSDKKRRKMVVVTQVFKKTQPSSIHSELANIGKIADGSYYCTWISGVSKGEGYFSEVEIQLQ